MERAEFVAFGTEHIAVLAIIAAACAISAWLSRGSAGEKRRWTAGTIGFVLLGYVIFFYVQQGSTARSAGSTLAARALQPRPDRLHRLAFPSQLVSYRNCLFLGLGCSAGDNHSGSGPRIPVHRFLPFFLEPRSDSGRDCFPGSLQRFQAARRKHRADDAGSERLRNSRRSD